MASCEHIGVVTVRGSDYHPNRRLQEAASEKGVGLRLINPHRMQAGIGEGRLYLADPENPGLPGVILPRQGAQIGRSSLTVLNQFAIMCIPLVIEPSAILVARNKFMTLQALAGQGIAVPDSVFADSPETFRKGIEHLGGLPVVVKKLSGRQGQEVFLVDSRQRAEQILDNHLDPAQGLLLQTFIPPHGRRDLRVLVIDREVVGAMEMSPPEDDFRSNFHITASSRVVDLSDGLSEMALAAARAIGLSMAGVDLIIDREGRAFVIEVNYSPGFRGLEAATGIDVAGRIIDYAVSFFKTGERC